MSCGCTDPCQPNSIPCTCEARVTSDCVTVSGATSNCLAIDDNLLLTDYLTQMDERICEKVDSVTNFIALENVGTGSQLYKGDSLLGKKQIRTVKSLDSALIVTETVDEIQLDLNLPAIIPPDGTDTKLVSGTNTTVAGNGSVATPYSVNVAFPTPPDGSETKVIAGTNTTVTGLGTTTSPYIVNSTDTIANDATTTIKGILKLANDLGGTADAPTTPTALHITGDETKNGNLGVNSLILANNPIGSVANEIKQTIGGNDWWKIYGKTDSLDRSEMVFEVGDNGTPFSWTGQRFRFHYDTSSGGVAKDPLIVDYNIISIDSDLSVTGIVTASSFIKTGGTEQQLLLANGDVSELNPQKTITTSYTLTDIDNNYTVFVNNGATSITITIDSSITLPNFCVGFIQEGTGDVTFVGTGVSLTNPVGLKSKGQGYATFIERKLNTTSFFLLGNTKI